MGDAWSDINYFLNFSLEKKEIIRLSLWYKKGQTVKRVDKLKEILKLMKYKERIKLTEEEATEPKNNWRLGYKYPFIPTEIQWKPNKSKKICYQFDGKSKKAKNFSSKEIEAHILNYIKEKGYRLIRLGWEKSLKQCALEASESELFIGIDSGMCYLAASVGIPIIF